MKPLYQTQTSSETLIIQHANTAVNTSNIQSDTTVHNIHRFTTETSSSVNTDSSNANVQGVQGINVNSTYPVPHGKQSISKPLWLGVDSKTKAKTRIC
jgi:hypothetical protein